MSDTIKLIRIYPNFEKPTAKEIAAKTIIWGVLPIEPIVEMILLPASYLVDRIRRLLGNKQEDSIEFNQEEIVVWENDKGEVFPLAEIQNLKINYTYLTNRLKKNPGTEKVNELSKISFQWNDLLHEFYYESREKEVLKLCKQLYAIKYKFKEYRIKKRVFLGKQPKYKEVQALKTKYGIEW